VPRTYCYQRHEGLDCPQRGLQLAVYERQVEAWLAGIQVPDDAVDRALAQLAAEARAVEQPEAERRKLESRLERLKELYSWGDMTREEYRAERDQIATRLRAFMPEPRQRRDLQQIAELARSAHATWLSAGQAERHELLLGLVQKIVVKNEQAVEIVPRPVFTMLVGSQPSSWSCGSDGDWRPATTVSRYSVPHNLLPDDMLRSIAVTASKVGIAESARRHDVSRQTVRRALELHGLASPWMACRR